MIDYRQTIRMSLALLSSLLLLALPACSDEEGGGEVLPVEETLYTVTLSLNPSTRGVGTKAGNEPYWGVDDDETLERYERYVKDCVVVIFQDGNWVQSLSYGIDLGDNDITIDNDTPESGTNATKVGTATVELPAGTYTFYAFANLTSLDVDDSKAGTELIEELIQGTSLKETELNKKTVSLGNDPRIFDPEDKVYIPMSSYGEKRTLTSDTSLDLTLFRMLGKVTIKIDNQTSGDLTLNSLEMGNFRRGNILLVPYGSGNTSLDNLTENNESSFNPILPTGSKSEVKSHEITFESESILKDGTGSYTFYEFETRSEQQTPSSSMWLKVGITGRDNSPQALDDFSFMRRNDWLNIPLMVAETDLTISIDGLRMPIGGTPYTITYNAQKPFIPSLDFTVKHAGEITIDFSFSMDGFTNIALDYAPEDGQLAGVRYTEAKLTENTNDLLYDATKQDGLKTGNLTINHEENSPAGSITVTTQELAYKGTATIELTLAVTYTKDGTPGRMTIPYTITITNDKEEGGN